MQVAYLFQSINTNLSESKAPQLHILYTIRGLQESGHQVSLLSLQSQRRVIFTDSITAITDGKILNRHYGKVSISNLRGFKLLESGIRKIQYKLNVPYFALFDNFRMFDACIQNINGYDLIHERYNVHSLGGALASRRLNIPYVLEVNADPISEYEFLDLPLSPLKRLQIKCEIYISAKTASKIICVSSQLKDFISSNWHVDAKKIAVLPNAANMNSFDQEYDKKKIRHQLGLMDEPVIMFVGGFYPWQDLNLLVDSFARVLKNNPLAKLVLVGDGKTKPDIEKKINADRLHHAVIFTGRVDHKNIPVMLAIADIAVAPNISFFEGHGGSPLKIFEYMASGKAIVATKNGQVKEIICSGEDGLLVEPSDVVGFTKALDTLLANPTLREKLGRAAYQRVCNNFTLKHYTNRLEYIYRDVLNIQ